MLGLECQRHVNDCRPPLIRIIRKAHAVKLSWSSGCANPSQKTNCKNFRCTATAKLYCYFFAAKVLRSTSWRRRTGAMHAVVLCGHIAWTPARHLVVIDSYNGWPAAENATEEQFGAEQSKKHSCTCKLTWRMQSPLSVLSVSSTYPGLLPSKRMQSLTLVSEQSTVVSDSRSYLG